MVSRVMAAANGTEYFAASWIAVWLVERVGRRPLMLFGAAGQCLTMMVLTITNSDSVTHPKFKPKLGETGGTNTGAAVVATVCLFLFNSFFAIGWLGMTWLTPAEMTPLSVRAAANGVRVVCHWWLHACSLTCAVRPDFNSFKLGQQFPHRDGTFAHSLATIDTSTLTPTVRTTIFSDHPDQLPQHQSLYLHHLLCAQCSHILRHILHHPGDGRSLARGDGRYICGF